MSDPNICPTCGEEAVSRCKCMRGDRRCKNGHSWHMCVIHKEIVPTMSDHSLPTFTCTCIDKPEEPQKEEIKCSFSTGICETITCSHDGNFDQYGYPVTECPEYPCNKIKKVRLQSDRRECLRRIEEIDAALKKLED